MDALTNTALPVADLSRILNLSLEECDVLSRAIDAQPLKKRALLNPSKMRALLERKAFHYPKKNIVFHCLKGGASKTTLAYNAAFRLAQLGCRVLFVDLDKQANATHTLYPKLPQYVFVDIIREQCSVEDAIVPLGEHLDLLPSSLENARLETELIHRRFNARTYYKKIFQDVRSRYDILIFDLPPDLNHNTYLCSVYANTLCIPVNADEYSVLGMKMTLESIEAIRNEFDDLKLDVHLIWSKFDGREKQAVKYIENFDAPDDVKVFPVVVRTDSAYKHAQSRRQSVFQLSRKSHAQEDMDILAQELMGLRAYFESTLGES